jgi:hypothetical protein
MKTLLFVFVCLSLAPLIADAKCTPKMTRIAGGAILSTETLYARPGQDEALYRATILQNQTLARHHLATYTVYRGPGGTQPAVYWQMTFPNMTAHDAWFKAANNMVESASEKAADNRGEAATLRALHGHYVMKEGFSMDTSACRR